MSAGAPPPARLRPSAQGPQSSAGGVDQDPVERCPARHGRRGCRPRSTSPETPAGPAQRPAPRARPGAAGARWRPEHGATLGGERREQGGLARRDRADRSSQRASRPSSGAVGQARGRPAASPRPARPLGPRRSRGRRRGRRPRARRRTARPAVRVPPAASGRRVRGPGRATRVTAGRIVVGREQGVELVVGQAVRGQRAASSSTTQPRMGRGTARWPGGRERAGRRSDAGLEVLGRRPCAARRS